VCSLRVTLCAGIRCHRFSRRRGCHGPVRGIEARVVRRARPHGTRFRSLNLPIPITRRMEHIFLASPHHLSIERALRRSELLALGASDELVDAVLATRIGANLLDGGFWRTVWMFLIANDRAIGAADVGPLIDFVHAIRHESVPIETARGIVMRDPPQPAFSMRDRTAQSMLRLMRDWHPGLGRAHGGLTWHPAPLEPMLKEEPSQNAAAPPAVWQLTELTNSEELGEEDTALRHCVASYAYRCRRGDSRIGRSGSREVRRCVAC
jgi:hypothetical protein